MVDRAELVEAALEAYREGLALLDGEDRVIFWNRAAEGITGYASAQVLGRQIPGPLGALTLSPVWEADSRIAPNARGAVVHAQHLVGDDLPVMARRMVLRNSLGERIGTAAIFHCADQSSAFLYGENGNSGVGGDRQSDLQERLEMEYQAALRGGAPLGVLWITVDRAWELRKTHGARACEAMLGTVERTLANALIGSEGVGRWSEDDFLVVAREGGGEQLASRAQVLAGVARTADFRWWGDRVSITVSIGVAIAEGTEPLANLLQRARLATEASLHAGGNHVTSAQGRQA